MEPQQASQNPLQIFVLGVNMGAKTEPNLSAINQFLGSKLGSILGEGFGALGRQKTVFGGPNKPSKTPSYKTSFWKPFEALIVRIPYLKR